MSQHDCLMVIYDTALLGKRFELDKGLITIGRAAGNDIALTHSATPSPRHAHLERRSGAWIVADDRSTCGVAVNGEVIYRETPLKDGDEIRIGTIILKLLSGPDVDARYEEEIVRLATIDGLTGAYNKRYLYARLESEIVRSPSPPPKAAIVVLDLDHFLRVNNRYGHLAGDFVLEQVARLAQADLGRGSVVARYGGEEFALLLPETSLDDAVALTEALRKKVCEHAFVFDVDTLRVTFSAGVTQVHEGDRTPQEVIARAEERLSCAKREGRDRVCW
jgi:two-component system cell cycle response regulator